MPSMESTLLIDVLVEGVSDNPIEPPPTHQRPERESHQKAPGSLFQYFTSSRNNHNIRPLTLTSTQPRKVPEVQLRIGSPPRHLRPGRCVLVAGKGKGPVPVEARKMKKSSESRLPLHEGKGKAPMSKGSSSAAPARSSMRRSLPLSGSPVRMIDEDGNEFVNCSDEETLFVLSADDGSRDEGDDIVVPTQLSNPVLQRRRYEASRRFQDTWAAKCPWTEMHRSFDGSIERVKCLLCSTIEGRDKILRAKWDTLTKHSGRRQATRDIPGIAKKGEYYYSKDCAHAKNAVLFALRGN